MELCKVTWFLSLYNTLTSVEQDGVKLSRSTGCMDNEPESSRDIPCQGLPLKTDQFQLDSTQSSAPRRQCDRVSSVSSPRTREVLWHLMTCDQHLLSLSACLSITISIPATSQPTIATTNYTHTPTVINSSAFHAQL